jgi:acylphosphatase
VYDDQMKKRLEATITGRVQMVMYRDYAQRKASKLGLVGTVQNLDDGSVAVVAEGDEEKLEDFIKYLNKGSILSKVKNVRITWGEVSGEFSQFKIVY